MENTEPSRDYRPFIPEVRKRGIGKTKAYELVAEGLLDTFLIGTKRYVFLDSLDALPRKLAAMAQETVPPVRGHLSATVRRAAGMRGVR